MSFGFPGTDILGGWSGTDNGVDEKSMKAKNRLPIRNRYILIVDILLTIAAVIGAYALRLEGFLFYYYLTGAYWMIGVSILIKPIIYYLFGLYRRQWAYASTSELKLISAAVTTASAVVSLGNDFIVDCAAAGPGFVRTTLIIDWLLSLVGIWGFRLALRLISETRNTNGKNHPGIGRNVLIVGAGDAGALVVREMQKNPQIGLRPIGFLDDDPNKLHHQIHGVPVIGKIADLIMLWIIARWTRSSSPFPVRVAK